MAHNPHTLTRRQLLYGLGAIGGAGAVYQALSTWGLLPGGSAHAAVRGDTATDLPSDALKGKKIAVLGAGIAGLCAAYRAANAGADVTIYEATGHIGGRSLTVRNGDAYKEWEWNSPQKVTFLDKGSNGKWGPDEKLQPFIFFDAANLLQNDS